MGSNHPLGVGGAAIHHFAAAETWVRLPISFGSPLERIGDDVVKKPRTIEGGAVEVSDLPGLGVELDDDKLARYAATISVDHRHAVTLREPHNEPWRTQPLRGSLPPRA
jgi:L-alanine-DL-glutamate epimerase-like enolase superfamily enzyme